MTSTSYANEWAAAVERSQRFGLKVPAHHVEPNKRYLNAQRIAEFPNVVRRGLGVVDAPDVMAQCLSMHYRLVPVMAEWFGCPMLYTLGWFDDGTEKGMFKFDDAFIADKLRNGQKPGKVNIHAWLTLPSMEIIDVTLATTMAIVHGRPEQGGGVVMGYADEFKGFAYRPMLVGTDFLREAGLLIELGAT
jgi:hypothetical protein